MSEPASYVDPASLREHLEGNVVKLARADGRPNRFRRERFSDIEPKPSEWLVKHFLPAEGVAIIAGPSTVGKSFVVLYICIRIALGKDIIGHKTKRSGIIYVAAEGQNGMRKRIKAIRDKWTIKTGLFQFIGVAPNLLEELDALELIESLKEGAAEMQAEEGADLGLVVIDTTAASMPGGNENSGEFMSKLLSNAGLISRETGSLVVLVGHTGKNEELGVRGWSGQIGNSDAILYLTRDKEEPDLRLGLVYKLKDGEDGERFAYRLKKIHMGLDADGDEISSAYPIFEDPPGESPPGRPKPPELKPGAKLIMRALRLLLDDGVGEPAPALSGVRPGTRAVTREQLREKSKRMGYAEGSEKPDSARRAFNRELQNLAALSRVRIEGEQVWPL